jgi:hypothetical protein
MNKSGSYTLTFDGDISRMTFSGYLTEQIATELMAKQRIHSKGRPYILNLCDMRNFDGVSPEARKIFAETSSEINNRGTAIYGASFQSRVIATLIMKAMSLFSKQDSPFYFCATEAEAINWLAARRQIIQAEQKL